MDKSQMLLNALIREFLRTRSPIGSEFLREQIIAEFEDSAKNAHISGVSSATIRNHFKALVESGFLSKSHASSGRVPTFLAMKNFWKKHLKTDKIALKISHLESCASKYQICALLKISAPNALLSVLNFGDSFLLLIFENAKVAVDFSPALLRFATSMKGMDIEEVAKMSASVGAQDLAAKLRAAGDSKLFVFSLDALGDLLSLMSPQSFLALANGAAFENLSNGVYFEELLPKGFLAVVSAASVADFRASQSAPSAPARLMCVGKAERDFGAFYEDLAS